MENKEKNSNEYYTIDLVHIFKSIIKRSWMIAVSAVLAAVIGFVCSAFIIQPQYSSSVMLYVNNSSFSLGNTSFSISSSEITAAQSLVKTYAELLKNRTTLERVIDKIDSQYTYKELTEMIVAVPSNDTEIMKVTVTADSPYDAAEIANCIAEVLPVRISEIIDGASMEVVDTAVPNLEKISPSITKYTAVGMFLGIFIAIIAIIILALLDDTVHDEEYILRTYDYPILAKIPNLLNSNSSEYGYYTKYKTPRA